MKSVRLALFGGLFGAVVALTACSKKDDAEDRRAAEAAVSAELPSEPASLPTEDAGGASLPSTDASARHGRRRRRASHGRRGFRRELSAADDRQPSALPVLQGSRRSREPVEGRGCVQALRSPLLHRGRQSRHAGRQDRAVQIRDRESAFGPQIFDPRIPAQLRQRHRVARRQEDQHCAVHARSIRRRGRP